VFKLMIKICGV